MVCPNCKNPIDSQSSFCTQCGAKISPGGQIPAVGTSGSQPYSRPVTPQTPPVTQKVKVKAMTIIIAAAVFVLTAAVSFFALSLFIGAESDDGEENLSYSQREDKSAAEYGKSGIGTANRPSEIKTPPTVTGLTPPDDEGINVQSPESTPPDISAQEVPAIEYPPVDTPEPNPAAPVFEAVSASDYTPATSMGSYEPERAIDGDTDTAWQVPDGAGHWIMLSSAEEQYVSGIRILNGFTFYSELRGDWLYTWNQRPKEITVSFSDGTAIVWELADFFDGGNFIYQEIPLPSPLRTTYVLISINSIYPGSRWNDTCISEIEVY